MSEAELFDYPIKQLPDRYGIAPSAVYVRMKRLNITPHTQGNRSYLDASQLDLMDDLHDFLTEDSSRSIDDFLRSLSAVEVMQQEFPATGHKETFNLDCYRYGIDSLQLMDISVQSIGARVMDTEFVFTSQQPSEQNVSAAGDG